MPSSDTRSELQALLDAAVDAIILIDQRGTIEVFNRAAERMFGYRAEEILGQNIAQLMNQEDGGRHDTYIGRYLRTGIAHIIGIGREAIAQRKDGSLFPVWLSVGQIAGAGEPRFVGFIRDLSANRQAELEVREARDRMLHVARLATMGEMATSISHEINQPLTAIANFAQAAARMLTAPQPDLTEVRDVLGQITAQALRTGEIIRRLRSLMRDRVTHTERGDVNQAIEEIEPLVRADARVAQVRVTYDLRPLPPISMDRIQLQQVFLNLLRNAIDALQNQAGACEVRVTSEAHDDEIEVAVADNGPGVSAEMVSLLFTPFATTKGHGTGLGLAISRTIVEAHHGRLEYRPNTPRGAVFTVTLPAGEDQ